MTERRNRNPNYDLQRHIVTGESGPFNGIGIVRDLDSSTIGYDDPMEFGGQANLFEGQSAEMVQSANLAQAVMLDSGATNGTEADMASLNDNSDPGKGGIDYGPRNLGGR